jgi:hypothetical protein
VPAQAGNRVRSTRDGQLGYLVETEDGRGLAVRLDRKAENRVVPFHPREWLPDEKPRLTPMQVARVAYAADREVRQVMGEYGLPDWMSLREPQRLAWLKGLQLEPGASGEAKKIRSDMYRSVLKVLAQ